MSKQKKALSPGLLKYQEEQRAKKAAAVAEELAPEQKGKQEELESVAQAKADAEEAAKKAVAAGAIKCARCGLVFEKSALITMTRFGGRLGCPGCGFPIPQK